MTATNVSTSASARVVFACAGLVIVLALLTLAGWAFGMSQLASLRDSYIPMAPSTALCFLGIGGALVSAQFSQRGLPRVLAGLVLLVALAKLIEFSFGMTLGIDERLVQDPADFGAVSTGRMSPITALIFLLLASGLFSITQPTLASRTGPLAALAGLIAAVDLLGYAYGTPLLYGGTIIPVAFTTALAAAISAVALLQAAGDEAWPTRYFRENSTRALLLRSFLPAVVAITLLNGWVRTIFLHHHTMNPAVSSAIAAIFFTLLMTGIISLVAAKVGRRIDAAEQARRRAQEELQSLNTRLEILVAERTRELQEKNAQMKEDLEMARELQFALLPQKFPAIPSNVPAGDSAVRFLSYYFPTGDVSGDFFSVLPVGEKAVGVFICDVMGHGVRAALVTSMIRALVEESGLDAVEPGALLTRINHGLATILAQAGITMYATGCYAVIDVGRGEMLYATAGHPRPLLISRGGHWADAVSTNGACGPALGIFPTAEYTMTRRSLAPGDLIMMFTDGLFEVEGTQGNLFDQQLLLAAARRYIEAPAGEFFEKVLQEVRAFSASESFDDDVCLVGIEVQNIEALGNARSAANGHAGHLN